MVVVELLSTNEDAPGHDVPSRIATLVVSIAVVVANAINHPCGEHGDPEHLHRPNGDAVNAKEQQIGKQHQHNAIGVMPINVALDPIVRATAPIALDGLRRLAILVQLGAFQEHFLQPQNLWTVGVLRGFTHRVVLAVNGGPLPRTHARGQPEPEPKKVLEHGTEL